MWEGVCQVGRRRLCRLACGRMWVAADGARALQADTRGLVTSRRAVVALGPPSNIERADGSMLKRDRGSRWRAPAATLTSGRVGVRFSRVGWRPPRRSRRVRGRWRPRRWCASSRGLRRGGLPRFMGRLQFVLASRRRRCRALTRIPSQRTRSSNLIRIRLTRDIVGAAGPLSGTNSFCSTVATSRL